MNSEAVHSQCTRLKDYCRREVCGTKGERCNQSKLQGREWGPQRQVRTGRDRLEQAGS